MNLYRLYTINLANGVATQVGTDITSFTGATFFGFDFNPVPDRIRIVNDNEQNVRVNPADAVVTLDGALAYATGDLNAGANPNLVGSGYTDSFGGSASTTLYGIDSSLDILVTQNPPNDGILNTRGPLGIDFSNRVAFDISGATTTAYATDVPVSLLSGSTDGAVVAATNLYTINLGNGAATLVGALPPGITLNGIAVPSPDAPGTKFGNLSTRVQVGTLQNVAIAGFMITGDEPKEVILRGIGPTLAPSGVPSPVADPILELYNSSNMVIAMNDNWRDTQAGEIIGTGLPPQNDLESAIVRTLPPGSYTVMERSKSAGLNIGLIEVYDVNRGSASQLANMSTRGNVGTGANVLIGGLIIAGSTSTEVIIRAKGPSLTTVPGALADPTLELFDSNGMSLAFNDNWRDTQEITISQRNLAPENNAESAIFRVLAPGGYTAIVRGKSNSTGVGLVEFFRVTPPSM